MIEVHSFTFGPFQENTYLIVDSNKNGVVIDPGMSDRNEQEEFSQFVESHQIQLKRLLLTHSHIDHVMGNHFICEKYGLKIEAHKNGVETLAMAKKSAEVYGIPYIESPLIDQYLSESDKISVGDIDLEILFTPGHAPDHIVFYNRSENWVVNGDVLFNGSVGRVDLPGSNPSELVRSILEKMYNLPEDCTVFCGHGPKTTIGKEMESNPFVNKNTDLSSYL